jgi:nickel/cobalt transporter (NicO) family protein
MFFKNQKRRSLILGMGILSLLLALGAAAIAHPLGNFTINHFARIEVSREGQIHLRYVIDMAEISTIQELQAAGVKDVNAPSQQELDAYLARVASEYPAGLLLAVDGSAIGLRCTSKNLSMPDGAGGLKTLRTELNYEGNLPSAMSLQPHSLHFEDNNHDKRIGWHELVVVPGPSVSIFNSSAYGSAVTDELKAYPQDAVAAPLNERTADLSFISGPAPAGARPLEARAGGKLVSNRDALAELISAPHITLLTALLGLLIAAALGSIHAMSPGHGKTVVGAYLVGSRGTAKHAAFLGLTVTITHTAGVFALGVVTLVASKYILPERLFPILSFLSGAMVVAIGFSLLVRRLRVALNGKPGGSVHGHSHSDDNDHSHYHHHDDHHDDDAHSHGHSEIHTRSHGGGHAHSHVGIHAHSDADSHHSLHTHVHAEIPGSHDGGHSHAHDHWHAEAHQHSHTHLGEHRHHHDHSHHSHGHQSEFEHDLSHAHVHSHGGVAHSHLPPGADGQPIGWRSLLALGISGGLLPCPSALVVLLAAISLHRVGYGLLLVIAFSAGLAGSLTAVGLLFVYAGRLMKSKSAGRMATLGRIVPVFSSLVITLAGSAICIEALGQAGIHVWSALSTIVSTSGRQPSAAVAVGWLAGVAALSAVGFYSFKSFRRRRHGW